MSSVSRYKLILKPCFVMQCLEDVGIRLKRFAGVSMGASVAGFLSVGFTSDELVTLYVQDLSIFIRGEHNP